MADKIVTRRGIYLYINGQEVKADIKSVRAEMTKLVNEQAKMTIGSEEYIRTGEKIKALDAIVKEHNRQWRNGRQEIDGTKNSLLSLSKMSSVFNKYFGMVTAFIASITGLTFAVRKCVDQFAELEETEADVMKYTGMTKEQVKDLNESFKDMDTRTARTELNKLAADAGRLGKQSKADILEFVEAANIIDVALGEDLGEGAVKNIGKLTEMFAESRGKGLKNGMLATASAINEVAQNSAASEAYLLEFTARVAGAGKQAGLSMTQIMGFASVLDQDMQKVEMSATALQTVIMKMFQEPAKFARLAGMEVKEFTALLKKDANEALLKLLSTLSQKGGLAQLAPIFKDMSLDGVRAAGVLSDLAANVDKVRSEQELATKAFNEGTSATNEYNVKNNTLQATIDKAKKRFQEMAYELGEKLAPHMSSLISKSSSLIKALSVIIGFVLSHSKGITALVVSLTTLVAVLKLHVLWTNRAAIAAKAVTVANTVLKGSLYALQVAYYTLTGQAGKARGAMIAFALVTNLTNPLFLLASAVTAVTAGLTYLLIKTNSLMTAQKAIKEATKSLNGELAKEQSQANKLFEALKRTNPEHEEHRKLTDEIIKLYGPYLKDLKDEQGNLTNIAKAQELVNTKIRESIALKIKNEAVDTVQEAGIKQQIDDVDELMTILQKQLGYSPEAINAVRVNVNKAIDQAIADGKTGMEELVSTIKGVLENETTDLYQEHGFWNPTSLSQKIYWLASGIYNTQEELKKVGNQFSGLISDATELNGLVNGGAKTDTGIGPDPVEPEDKAAIQRKQIAKALKEVEETHLKEMAALKKKYLASDIDSEVEYNREVQKLQDSYDTARKTKMKELLEGSKEVKKITDANLRTDLATQIAGIDDKNLDRQIVNMNKLKSILLDADPVAKEKQQYENRLRELDLFGVDRERMTTEQLKALDTLERQHEENMRKLSSREANLKLKELDEAFAEEEKKLNYRRVYEKMTDAQYRRELLQLELTYLNKRLSINGLSAEKIKEINKEIFQVQSDLYSNNSDDRKNALEKFGLDNLKETKEEELRLLQYYEDQGVLTHQEAMLAREYIDRQYTNGVISKVTKTISTVQSFFSNLSGTIQNNLSAEEIAITTRYDKEIAAAEGNSEKQKAIEDEKQEALNAIRAEYADKQFSVTVAQIIATTAVAAMEAYKAMAGIPVVGPALGIAAATATIAFGGSQIAVAREQRDAAKAGYFKGGYTGGTDPREIRGYFPDGQPYHGGEFVANHKTVQMLKPAFDIMDYAQRTGNMAALTGPDMASAIGGTPVKESSSLPSVPYPTDGAGATNPEDMVRVLSGVVKSLNLLNKKLDEPFIGEFSITGEKGFEKVWNEYNKLIKNASR
jgi:TP901 family phage tail tape measure protein